MYFFVVRLFVTNVLDIYISLLRLMQQYYLHNQYINNGARKNPKPVKLNHQPMLCLSNQNTLEFYQYTSNGIRNHAKYNFNCSIARIEVLPTKEHSNGDYIFIVDKKGRYGFWHHQGGFQLVQNSKADSDRSLYKNDEAEEEVAFSGEMHHFDVFDTKGSVFFAIHHTVVVIDYSITRLGLKIEKTRTIRVPYVQYRFVNWVQNAKNSKMLGIIEEIQERTVLKVHNLDHSSRLNEENLVYKKEKVNLLEFVSQNDELLLVSDDEITTIFHENEYEEVYHYKVHNATSGKVVSLSQKTYSFIGQELMIFTKGKLRSYGSFRHNNQNIFEKKGILSAQYLTLTEDQGLLLCINTLNNQTYLIVLHQNTWKLYYHLKALTSIYSVIPTNNDHSVLAVMDQSADSYQVVIVEKQSYVPLVKEQVCSNTVDRLICVEDGPFFVVCSSETNAVFKSNQNSGDFDMLCNLPCQNILAISKNILITDQAIYAVSLQNSFTEQLSREEITLAAANSSRMYFMGAQGVVKCINLQSNDSQVVRDSASDEYIWHLQSNNYLVTARTNNLSAIYVYQDGELVSEIELQESGLISSFHHYSFENDLVVEELIVVGYMNGHIHLYNNSREIKAKFNDHSHEPITFFPINNSLLGVLSGSKQFILSVKNGQLCLTPLQFSKTGDMISSVAYFPQTNQFIFLENNHQEASKLIRIISLNDVYCSMSTAINSHDSYCIKTICDNLPEIPTVFVHNRIIYIGINTKLRLYQLQSGRLLKTVNHYLKDVIGIFLLQCGLVLYGVDSIERNLIYVLSLQDYEEIGCINFILKDNKYIKSIKEIPNTNRFICRGETFTTVCEINCPKEITEIHQLKTDLTGYSLDVDSQYQLFAETDSKRLLLLFTYDKGILPIARYISNSEINDFLILHRCIILGDKAGFIQILELNTEDDNQVLRMNLTKVASIDVGDEITCLGRRSENEIYYGTITGKIGVIKIIEEGQYIQLKAIEDQIYKQLTTNTSEFSYSEWRSRNIKDKLIDGSLIKKYLKQNERRTLGEQQTATYQSTHLLYDNLIHT